MDIKSIKSKVLQSLIDEMDSRMSGDLKSKSPKFAKVNIQSDDPKLAEELKDKLMGDSEDISEDPLKEMSSADFKEDKLESEDPLLEKDHEDKEDLERLMELYRNLK